MNGEWFGILRDIAVFFATMMLIKYFIFLMVAPWHRLKIALYEYKLNKNKPAESTQELPLVSVIVPAWDEEVGILRTVRSLLKNSYRRIEIIVVNDGSTDDTHDIMQKFMKSAEVEAHHPRIEVRYVSQPNGGKGKALNAGVELAKGEIIVTMDADSIFTEDALSKIVNYFKTDPSIDALVGNVKVAANNTLIGKIQTLEYMFGFYHKRAHCVLGAEYIYGGACAAFRKATTFDTLGLFDHVNKTEDIEMSMRTKYYGLKSIYAEDVVCYTEGASTINGLINQRLRWKKGRFDTFVKYRRMFFSGDKHHRKTLGWFILPFSLLAELQLLFEPIAISILLTYSFISFDYASLALGTLFIAATYLVVAIFGREFKPSLLFAYPFTWPLFYLLVWVEYVVLVRSLWMSLRGEKIVWQDWDRRGVEVEKITV